MKLIVLSALLLPSMLLAQIPPPGAPMAPRVVSQYSPPGSCPEALPDNYQVTLNITDKEGPPLEISVVVASSQFSASLGEQSLGFSGQMKVEEAGGIVMAYTLNWQTPVGGDKGAVQFVPSNVQGSVRLKLGEEVQIIRAGTRVALLSVKKAAAGKEKGK